VGGITALTRLDPDRNPLTSVLVEWKAGGALDESGCPPVGSLGGGRATRCSVVCPAV